MRKVQLAAMLGCLGALLANSKLASADPIKVIEICPSDVLARLETVVLIGSGFTQVTSAEYFRDGQQGPLQTQVLNDRVMCTTFPQMNPGRVTVTLNGSGVTETFDLSVVRDLPPGTVLTCLLEALPFYWQSGLISNQGVFQSLETKLREARKSIGRQNFEAAEGQVTSALHLLSAQTGKFINPGLATELIRLIRIGILGGFAPPPPPPPPPDFAFVIPVTHPELTSKSEIDYDLNADGGKATVGGDGIEGFEVDLDKVAQVESHGSTISFYQQENLDQQSRGLEYVDGLRVYGPQFVLTATKPEGCEKLSFVQFTKYHLYVQGKEKKYPPPSAWGIDDYKGDLAALQAHLGPGFEVPQPPRYAFQAAVAGPDIGQAMRDIPGIHNAAFGQNVDEGERLTIKFFIWIKTWVVCEKPRERFEILGHWTFGYETTTQIVGHNEQETTHTSKLLVPKKNGHWDAPGDWQESEQPEWTEGAGDEQYLEIYVPLIREGGYADEFLPDGE